MFSCAAQSVCFSCVESRYGDQMLMPTAGEALLELAAVFRLIKEEHRESGKPMPRDTEIVQSLAQ
jgi:hypothetical protein